MKEKETKTEQRQLQSDDNGSVDNDVTQIST